jgi:hypothetical protein
VNEPEERSRHSARDMWLGHRCEPRTSRGLTLLGFSGEQPHSTEAACGLFGRTRTDIDGNRGARDRPGVGAWLLVRCKP